MATPHKDCTTNVVQSRQAGFVRCCHMQKLDVHLSFLQFFMTETEVYAEIEKAVNEVNSRLPVYKRIKAWKIRKSDFLRTSLKKIIRTGVNIDE